VFVIARGKPLTLAIELVGGDDSKVDAVERVLARVENTFSRLNTSLSTAQPTSES